MADESNKIAGTDIGNGNGGKSIDLPIKRGPGRPPGSSNKPKTNAVPGVAVQTLKTGSSKGGNNSSPNPETVDSAKFIGYGAVSLLEMVEEITHGKVKRKVAKNLPGHLAEFEKVLIEYKLTPKEREVISASVERIALRHEWLTKFAPEVVLLLTIGKYTTRQFQLVNFVENVIAEANKERPKPKETEKNERDKKE